MDMNRVSEGDGLSALSRLSGSGPLSHVAYTILAALAAGRASRTAGFKISRMASWKCRRW